MTSPSTPANGALILRSVALHMHERQLEDVDVGDLSVLLKQVFFRHRPRCSQSGTGRRNIFMSPDPGASWNAVERAGEGAFAFTHLTFQEYLAALAVAAQDDYLEYTLKRVPEAWWREVILLEAAT